MITIHSFTEAFLLYRQDRIPFRLLQEQAAVTIGLCKNQHAGVGNSLDITSGDVQWLALQPEAREDYVSILGGNTHICETEADLLQIQGCDFEWAETHGRWPNVTELAMSWDDCSFVTEADGRSNWVLFLLCWNDAGGPVYYVPRSLWSYARVDEHIAATQQAWNT